MAESKVSSFLDRMDVAVTEFLQKSKSQIALNTPSSIESNLRIFKQRIAEKMAKPGDSIHITPQPEVDEASAEVQNMFKYFDELDLLVKTRVQLLKSINENEQNLALFFQQKGYQEKVEEISNMSIDVGKSYAENVKTRSNSLLVWESFSEFVDTFKTKAIQDSVDTMKKQELARVEFDSFAAKVENIQRGVSLLLPLSANNRSGSTILGKELPATLDLSPIEKELEHAKNQFQAAKQKYQNLSTAIIDKAVLLELKRDVDFKNQLEKVWLDRDSK